MTGEEKEEAKDIYERYIWDITRMVLQGNFSMLVMDEVIGEMCIRDSCDRYMEHILTEKRQSCCAAGDQIIRKNKKGNSDSINQIAQGNN